MSDPRVEKEAQRVADQFLDQGAKVAKIGTLALLRKFSTTPIGRAVQAAAEKAQAVKEEGREIDADDVLEFCTETLHNLRDEEDEESDE